MKSLHEPRPRPVDLLPERLVAHRGGGAAGRQHEPGADVLEHRLRVAGRVWRVPRVRTRMRTRMRGRVHGR